MHTSDKYSSSYTSGWLLTSLLRNHINEMINRYSCLRALRIDLFYKRNSFRLRHSDHRQLEHEVRFLMQEMMKQKGVVGYFWVIEWTTDHGWHAHVAFWLDRHITQTTWPTAKKASDIWKSITEQEGGFYRCEYKENYQANINIPVCYNDPYSIENIHRVLSYLAKEEQKDGFYLYGCNDVPPRPASGRPRKSGP
ncbi:rolling circle replication-associated protein [Citrobacter amalonaticus]|uniref:rolling circle replication-associated protein n=1 Tax=Citrobacter amalonaticus TaxID=35703 RepID=UPI003D6DAE6E